MKIQSLNKTGIQNLSELPIGVFDSGMGGLTVLRSIRNLLPNESLIYLGDTARLPYGTKSLKTVQQYAKQMVELLIQQPIKLLVIACNTATTAALHYLQATFPSLPIIGVIEPGSKAAAIKTRSHEIAVLATETTIRSNIYELSLQRHNANIRTTNIACGLFVALAEEGCVTNSIAKAAIEHYLSPLKNKQNVDCAVLGCTHFPALKPTIQDFLGPNVEIIDSALATAKTVADYLKQNNLMQNNTSVNQQFYVTDQPERFIRLSSIFYEETIDPKLVEFIDLRNWLIEHNQLLQDLR